MIDDINRNIIDRIVVERSKQFDSAIFGEIQQIAIENGIETRITMNEKAIADALKKQIPMKPKDEGWLYCPVCGKDVCVDKPEYCSDCGQKLDWSD